MKINATTYAQPVIAFVVMTGLCLWGIVPHSKNLDDLGHLIGEHTVNIYNGMLVVSGVILLRHAIITNNTALKWRIFDLSICCAIASLGLKELPLNRPSGGPHGFPSGHTLTAFAAAWLMMAYFPKLSIYAFAIACAVGWSRVQIHEHFVYQVLIGGLIGIVIGLIVTLAKDGVGVIAPRVFVRRRLAVPIESPNA